MKRHIAAKLPNEAQGRSLLDYLSGRFTYHTRQEWAKHVAEGEILLDGVRCQDPEQLLQSGMLLSYDPKDLAEPPVSFDCRILYEDEFLLVIDKPGNLPVHPAGPYFNHTLWAYLLEVCKEQSVHFVNRLDRETSGVMLVARVPWIAERLSKELPNMRKCYLAAVHGNFAKPVDAVGFLIKDSDSVVRKKRKFVQDCQPLPLSEKPESASTELMPEAYCNGLSLVSAVLHTGRLHQIRATLFSLGFPVVGDKLYGLDESFYVKQRSEHLTEADRRKLILPRQALHCRSITFRHPVSNELLTFSSPLPECMQNLFEPLAPFV